MTTADRISYMLVGVIADHQLTEDVDDQELSDRAGISIYTLSSRLAGESEFTITELVTIAHALGTEASELIGLAEFAVSREGKK